MIDIIKDYPWILPTTVFFGIAYAYGGWEYITAIVTMFGILAVIGVILFFTTSVCILPPKFKSARENEK